jgi:hypothetical protein
MSVEEDLEKAVDAAVEAGVRVSLELLSKMGTLYGRAGATPPTPSEPAEAPADSLPTSPEAGAEPEDPNKPAT